jgi:hypothetical protein
MRRASMTTNQTEIPLCRPFRAGGAFGIRVVRFSPEAALGGELASLGLALEARELVLELPRRPPSRSVRRVLAAFRRDLECSGRRLVVVRGKDGRHLEKTVWRRRPGAASPTVVTSMTA